MGLKAYYYCYYVIADALDKIRPKWDWKVVVLERSVCYLVQIKSDQNGIESEVDESVPQRFSVDRTR